MLDQFVVLANIVKWVLIVYMWMHIAAFVLSWINADPGNSIVSFINRFTMPMWNWLSYRLPRQIAPLAPFCALMIVLFAEIALPGIIRSTGAALGGNLAMEASLKNMVFYLLYGGFYIISNIFWFIFLLSVLWFIFTLVNPPITNPIVRSVMYIIDPLITPLQRVLPRARIDLSPIALALITFLIRGFLDRMVIPPIQAGLVI